MPEDCRNDGNWRLRSQQPLCKVWCSECRPDAAGFGTRSQPTCASARPPGGGGPVQRGERWCQAQEHLPVGRRWPSGMQVVDQRSADLLAHRQYQRRAGLGLFDLEGGRGPVQIIELKILTSPRCRPRRAARDKDRTAVSALGGTAVDRRQVAWSRVPGPIPTVP